MIASALKTPLNLSASQMEMIDAGGRLCQLIGVPRSVGQIYGLLFMSTNALSLDDIATRLGMSKGSASTGTRQLMAWRAIRHVWVPGERRDHFVVDPDLGNLIRSTYGEFLKPRMNSSSERIERIAAALKEEETGGDLSEADYQTCTKRLETLQRMHKKLKSLIPIAEKFL